MAIESYRDLRVWREAMDPAESSHRLTAAFPREETSGLAAQIRRAAVSIPANVAEGYGRDSTAYGQFLSIAQGSLKELETHLLLSERLALAAEETVMPLLSSRGSLGRMLRSPTRAIERSSKPE